MDALKLLDEDSWEEVLNQVDDPKDLWSCNEVCLLFQKILRTKKNAFMSSLILPHLLPYLRDAGVPPKDKLEELKALSKYRLVCKTWCNSLDRLHEYVEQIPCDPAFAFISGEQTENFLQMFATHNGNPFRGRPVSLVLTNPLLLAEMPVEAYDAHEDEPHFHVRKLRHLLKRFGDKMCAVNLLEANENEELAFWNNLRTILAHLPNLRGVQIIKMNNVLGDELEQSAGLADRELSTCMTPDTLPGLPLLESLVFNGIYVRVLSLILEKYGPMLKSLFVGNLRGFPEQDFRLSNLETLTLRIWDARTSLHGLRQVHAPQLRNLVVKLEVTTNRNYLEVWPIDELFRNIQHLPIQSLEITVTGENVFVGESETISAEHRAQHESIASVRLCLMNGSVSLNFLLSCPKVKSIYMFRLRQGAGHPYGVPELLDANELVEQDGHDLYQSNIWEKLPNLESFQLYYVDKNIKLRLDEYVRAKYESRKLEERCEDRC